MKKDYFGTRYINVEANQLLDNSEKVQKLKCSKPYLVNIAEDTVQISISNTSCYVVYGFTQIFLIVID